jgi:nucleoside phosphorylase
MSMVNIEKIGTTDRPEPTNKFLVVSALPDEMEAFYNTNEAFKTRTSIEKGSSVNRTILKFKSSAQTILTFTSARMGMPHNSASIMQVIEKYQPAYILFIGTCASLKNGAKLGDVIIPKTVFNYELGKYKNLAFLPDNDSYKMSELILERAESLRTSKPDWLKFNVVTDDDFYSGSVVVDSKFIKWLIKRRASRKANGLDMEAYSLGAIAYLQKLKHVGVIKGVMDLGLKKSDNSKILAMANAAKFTFELLTHIENADIRSLI